MTRLQKLTPIRGRKHINGSTIPATLIAFTEVNPDKGTETPLMVVVTKLVNISLQKLTPIRGRKQYLYLVQTTYQMIVFTEVNPDKGTETHHALIDSIALPMFTEVNPDKGTETW